MDLFERHRQEQIAQEAPLAARMRPRTLDDYVGQDAIVGPGRLLRRAIQADQLSSLLFYGPPGTGKTTLARVIANTTQAHFIAINAVLSGVKAIRDAIATAQDLRGQQGQRTILFVDEVHRFNKAQQDALLPWVENGTVILIGATTENPYFEVNKALVSRSRVFQLQPLDDTALQTVLNHALNDTERGYGNKTILIDPEAAAHLINVANGDARALLNALELAVETTALSPGPNNNSTIHITLPVAEDSIQQRAVLYDKEGDAHFDTISAFIKSMRGSDPDATLYWLARMVYAGEDPRFIFRRMLIFAGEDVGLAEPQAMTVVNSCAQAFDRVGLPEGRYPLAQAALYLANCPKSNSVMGFFDALAAVEKERETDIPNPLKDGNRDGKGFGHGKGYLYPHAYRDHWVEQQYLPRSLQGQVFYQPSNQGYEATIQHQVARRREAQLAALVDRDDGPARLTFGPTDQTQERWLQRAMGAAGERLRGMCDRTFQILNPQRHHLILDLNATTGLFTWEALRQVPEGGVTACVHRRQDHAALVEQIAQLDALNRPDLIQASLADLPDQLQQQFPNRRFDGIVGRNALMAHPHRERILTELVPWLHPSGQIILAEAIGHRAQRLYDLLPETALPQRLKTRLQDAEESLYGDPQFPHLSWEVVDAIATFEQAGLSAMPQIESQRSPLTITEPLLQRWFAPNSQYLQQLSQHIPHEDLQPIRQAFLKTLRNKTVDWQRWVLFITGTRP